MSKCYVFQLCLKGTFMRRACSITILACIMMTLCVYISQCGTFPATACLLQSHHNTGYACHGTPWRSVHSHTGICPSTCGGLERSLSCTSCPGSAQLTLGEAVIICTCAFQVQSLYVSVDTGLVSKRTLTVCCGKSFLLYSFPERQKEGN